MLVFVGAESRKEDLNSHFIDLRCIESNLTRMWLLTLKSKRDSQGTAAKGAHLAALASLWSSSLGNVRLFLKAICGDFAHRLHFTVPYKLSMVKIRSDLVSLASTTRYPLSASAVRSSKRGREPNDRISIARQEVNFAFSVTKMSLCRT